MLTVKPKAVLRFLIFFLVVSKSTAMATVKGGLQCAKAFNGFMSSCDLGPDSWGGNADILSVVKLKKVYKMP